jgi:hypothetical protein
VIGSELRNLTDLPQEISMSALAIYRIPEVLDQPGTAVITRELQLSVAEFFG